MQVNIPKIIVVVDLGEYAPELTGNALHVWVNPSLQVLRMHDEILSAKPDEVTADEKSGRLFAWYAALWSHGPDGTRWTAQEVKDAEERDPSFTAWMISRTWQARNAHITAKKKGLTTPSPT
jgi:hypothetical protein